ncbi:uncharacterized protein TM35_000222380 [Trypanosoma theileri]|uniref:Uncharacterized protein n=1 Tax=Trypanosoma theileri TaxID=67003 RepID=A0A1X0NTC9_9TRYP|nr:uncharacterized protein TM35_000222380 [Trypanosoma theileri]ORC87439.1 hypothetical protein TM35_000222380 [Trypanosoma theileri]
MDPERDVRNSGVEEESAQATAMTPPVFFHLNMREITNALLVPSDALSAKLQKQQQQQVQQNNNNNNNSNSNSSSSKPNNSNSNNNAVDVDDVYVGSYGSVVDVGSLSRSQRYHRHHNTLKAAVLQSPDSTYYVEETLLIGSVGSIGRRGGLLDTSGYPNSEQRRGLTSIPKTTTSIPASIPIPTTTAQSINSTDSSPIMRSAPLPVNPSSTARTQQGTEFSCTPSLRSVTFLVRKPSKSDPTVDAGSEDDGELERPLMPDNTTNGTRKKKKKSVRFPENVIKSVSFVQADDQLHLLVQYNRPWYAHLVLVIASAFFVLHWGFIARVTNYSTFTERIGVSAVISFVAFGFAAAYLLCFLALSWRPDREEREYLFDFSRNRSVIYVITAGVIAQLCLVCAFMFCVNVVGLVCFCCFPLILTYLYEEYKKHSVSVLDAVGCVLVVSSIVVFTVGAEVRGGGPYTRVLTVVFGMVGGIAMAFFLFQLRTVSRHVSNLFVMSSTITITTLVLAFISYATNGFTIPIGESHRPLTEISSSDFLNIILSALFLFLSWFAYHWSSLFFDRMTLSGSFSLGGPISLLVFFLLSLPTAALPYEIAGGVAMGIGCALVLYSGYRFRQSVEVRIELEQE